MTNGRVPRGLRAAVGFGDIADDLTRRLVSVFLTGPDGRRPVHGTYDLLATDPRWKDNVPFHEYFHGDTGAGLGACTRPAGRRSSPTCSSPVVRRDVPPGQAWKAVTPSRVATKTQSPETTWEGKWGIRPAWWRSTSWP